jgi:hypothetical protein
MSGGQRSAELAADAQLQCVDLFVRDPKVMSDPAHQISSGAEHDEVLLESRELG